MNNGGEVVKKGTELTWWFKNGGEVVKQGTDITWWFNNCGDVVKKGKGNKCGGLKTAERL